MLQGGPKEVGPRYFLVKFECERSTRNIYKLVLNIQNTTYYIFLFVTGDELICLGHPVYSSREAIQDDSVKTNMKHIQIFTEYDNHLFSVGFWLFSFKAQNLLSLCNYAATHVTTRKI